MADDDFQPRLGRSRAAGAGPSRKYLHRVIAAVQRAGGMQGRAGRRFNGARLARGTAIARVLGGAPGLRPASRRRVVVKTRLVRLAGTGLGGARAHLRYLLRDGVAADGQPARLYGDRDGEIDGNAFVNRADGDRHQFRFIVSAEDGAEYGDLKPLIRRWMTQMEGDLGTRLDWVAVDHLDTGHPHTHVMLRGTDARGDNLVIAPEYIASGMRARLAELVTLDLGPRSALDVERQQRLEMTAERVTRIDRRLIAEAADGEVAARHPQPSEHALRAGRLRKLAALGLAEPATTAGHWRLAPDLVSRLRALGERGDIVRTLQRTLAARGRPHAVPELVVHQPVPPASPIVGRLAARGLSDELRDRHYLIVEGVDGRAHYVDIGSGSALGPVSEGAIVRITPAPPAVRPADLTIAAVAHAHAGRYSAELHRGHDPAASPAYIAAHIRRLEALRRATGAVDRLADGQWLVGASYLDACRAYEAGRARARPVRIEMLSYVPLPELPAAAGATWLDRELVADAPVPLRDAGFGREARAAREARRQWLLSRGLAQDVNGETLYARNLLAHLRREEVLRSARSLSDELGLAFDDAEHGRPAGRLVRRIDLASGRFGVLARQHDFSLVPWRDGMEARVGRELSVTVGGRGASWSVRRERGGPEIG